MYNKDKLNNLGMKVTYMKVKTEGKRRMSVEEREKINANITFVVESITDLLNDNEVELETKKQLANNTRKQIVLINKVLDNLEKVISIAKQNID
ncbi:hypothetical protein [Sinanaerobacter sp. ZZT-01]|uniref:hypothetical protein n=1 Tax=Sinanaerobacter sp. ZZT-01 TaxID=3111540 RepID=UPI002D7743C9|nr:hypothetical protein [Sinanaerobacter sp. ZZT-01]WRR92717.1 hypothetical protein U5921_11770 [Sinanaerobacter sp. ZZT-01]